MGPLSLTPYAKLETPRLRGLLRRNKEGLLGRKRRPNLARRVTRLVAGMEDGQETHESRLPFCSGSQLVYLCGFGNLL